MEIWLRNHPEAPVFCHHLKQSQNFLLNPSVVETEICSANSETVRLVEEKRIIGNTSTKALH